MKQLFVLMCILAVSSAVVAQDATTAVSPSQDGGSIVQAPVPEARDGTAATIESAAHTVSGNAGYKVDTRMMDVILDNMFEDTLLASSRTRSASCTPAEQKQCQSICKASIPEPFYAQEACFATGSSCQVVQVAPPAVKYKPLCRCTYMCVIGDPDVMLA